MDHVIDYIKNYMQEDVDSLKQESESGKYKNIRNCPSYGTVKAYCEALKPLYKYMYGEELEEITVPTPSNLIK